MPAPDKIAWWLNKIADELDDLYGSHPRVPRTQVEKIARRMINDSDETDKDALRSALLKHVRITFKGTDLDY